ncbi:MAG: acetylxylan esterase [Pirellulaceae bacterium]|nr:acetylxylan esterase [Planctomycetales bacterium]
MRSYILATMLLGSTFVTNVWAQPQPFSPNYDEDKVPKFELPDPLVAADGSRVDSADAWRSEQRPRLLKLFAEQMFGITPTTPFQQHFTLHSADDQALDGTATRKLVTINVQGNGRTLPLDLLIYLPNKTRQPAPIFVGLNFEGNHTAHADPEIPFPRQVYKSGSGEKIVPAARGAQSGRWPVEQILARGYGVATMYCGDIDPDFDDQFANGVHPLFYEPGQSQLHDDQWGTIGAWAWGLSRIVDYLMTDADIDHERIIVMGHSRLGKTAMWAAAQDERFAAAVSNSSGCGGAALSRRRFGETVQRINQNFPHWFCRNFKKYNNNEDALPIDQHELVALVAPRPILICSAVNDRWADPRGEFLSGKYASPVFRLLGVEGMAADEMPAVDAPVYSRIGYRIREGDHQVLPGDWSIFCDFADHNLPSSHCSPQ